VNNSISKRSANWPTIWPPDSFRAGPTLLLILAIVIVSALVLAFGIAILRPEIIANNGTPPVVGAVVVQLVLEVAVVAVIIAALPRISGFSLHDLGFKAVRGRDIVYGLLGAVAMIVIVQGASALVDLVSHQQHQQQVVELFKSLRAPGAIWFFAIFAAVIAPIAEETIFRVFLFNAGMRYGGFWSGAILSGLLFGAVHGDKFAFLPLALGGVLLCWLYYRTGNAFTSMISHGLFNAVTLLAIVFAPKLAQ
jgi:uncharacterized protein